MVESLMKIEKTACFIGLNFIVIAMGALLVGCAGAWHAYSGPARPRNEVAILKCGVSSGLKITSVDGKPTSVPTTDWTGAYRDAGMNWDGSTNKDSSGFVTEVELLPGPHQIAFDTWVNISTGDIIKNIDVTSGEKYVAIMHKLKTDADDYMKIEEVRWTVWIRPEN
jgi:hypothetical protein